MTERPWGRDIRSFMIKPKAERQAEQRRKLEEARQATERTFEEELAAVLSASELLGWLAIVAGGCPLGIA